MGGARARESEGEGERERERVCCTAERVRGVGGQQGDLKLEDIVEPTVVDEVLRSSEGSDPSEYFSQSPEYFSESCPSDMQLIDKDPVDFVEVDSMGQMAPHSSTHGEVYIETSFWDTLMPQE